MKAQFHVTSSIMEHTAACRACTWAWPKVARSARKGLRTTAGRIRPAVRYHVGQTGHTVDITVTNTVTADPTSE